MSLLQHNLFHIHTAPHKHTWKLPNRLQSISVEHSQSSGSSLRLSDSVRDSCGCFSVSMLISSHKDRDLFWHSFSVYPPTPYTPSLLEQLATASEHTQQLPGRSFPVRPGPFAFHFVAFQTGFVWLAESVSSSSYADVLH